MFQIDRWTFNRGLQAARTVIAKKKRALVVGSGEELVLTVAPKARKPARLDLSVTTSLHDHDPSDAPVGAWLIDLDICAMVMDAIGVDESPAYLDVEKARLMLCTDSARVEIGQQVTPAPSVSRPGVWTADDPRTRITGEAAARIGALFPAAQAWKTADRPALVGVTVRQVNGAVMAYATDGHSAAACPVSAPGIDPQPADDEQVWIHRTVAKFLAREDGKSPVEVRSNGGLTRLDSGPTTWTWTQQRGPDLTAILVTLDSPPAATIPVTGELLAALSTVVAATVEGVRVAVKIFAKGTTGVRVTNQPGDTTPLFDASTDAVPTGVLADIGVDARLLLRALQMSGATTIDIRGEIKPIMLSGAADGRFGVVMPMRL